MRPSIRTESCSNQSPAKLIQPFWVVEMEAWTHCTQSHTAHLLTHTHICGIGKWIGVWGCSVVSILPGTVVLLLGQLPDHSLQLLTRLLLILQTLLDPLTLLARHIHKYPLKLSKDVRTHLQAETHNHKTCTCR